MRISIGRTGLSIVLGLCLLLAAITFPNAKEGVLKFDVPPQFDRNPQNNRVGFDGIPRFSPGRYGLPAAALGKWVSDSSIVVDINGIANNLDFVLKMDFAENRITGTIKSDVFQDIFLRGVYGDSQEFLILNMQKKQPIG